MRKFTEAILGKRLSTPHGTLGTGLGRLVSASRVASFFQLHTVHQERYYYCWTSCWKYCLSTPHGTLGTPPVRLGGGPTRKPFNSTRYIRNKFCRMKAYTWQVGFFQLHTVHQEPEVACCMCQTHFPLSTPHGTLGTPTTDTEPYLKLLFMLSTPHGTLGTMRDELEIFLEKGSFNSTRYIRNLNWKTTL